MLMQKKMGLVVTTVTLILTVLTFAPYLIPLAVISDGTTQSESIVEPAPAPPGMLAYWEMNENGGTIVHDSISPYVDGYTYGGAPWIPGIAESGLQLLSNQFIEFAHPESLYAINYLTIEAWVKLSDTSGLHTILMNSYSTTYTMYNFAIEDGHLYFDRQSGAPGNSFTSSAVITANEWHHVAVVMNTGSKTISFYIDGAEEIIDDYDDYFSGPTGRVTIGADRTSGTPTFLQGMIDEVAVYNRIVMHSIIQEHYDKGVLGLGYLDDFPTNIAPIAFDDSYIMDQDTVLPVGAPGVLANDIDDDGDPLETSLVSGPSNGGLVLNPDGSFVYTPLSGFVGMDAFEYRAYDGADYSASATVTITVHAVNHPPMAEDDAYVTDEDVPLSIASPGVTANDHDVDSWDSITAELVTGPEYGLLTLFPEGAFVYTPNSDWFGTDAFTYRVFDGTVYGNVATVTIAVNSINDAPVALDDDYFGTEDNELVESSVLTNDYDVDGDSFAFFVATQPSHGSLDISPDGSFTYFPDPDWFGIDSFTYQITDGQESSNVATVTLTIVGVNDVPVAGDDSYSGVEDIVLLGPSVLLNDYDADEDSLEILLASGPSHGVLTLYPDGSFTFMPNANWFGTDSFTYELYDGQVYSNTATVVLTIVGENDAPIAFDASFSGDEDADLYGTLLATDVDGNPITYESVTGPSHGTLIFNPDGTFTFSPDANWFGFVTFTFRVFDGQAYSNIATVTITIRSVNDVPTAVDDEFTAYEDTELVGSVLDNDFDIEWDIQEAHVVSGPAHGVLDFNINSGIFTYVPDANWFGTDSFTYYVFDGHVFSNVATVTLTIVGVNDAPFAYDGLFTGYEYVDLDGTLPLAADVDGDPITYESVTGPSHGILVFTPDGTFTYCPEAGWFGTDSFTYRVFDGTDYSNIASVTIEIIEEDDITGPEITIVYSGGSTDGNPGTWTVSVIDPESGVDWINVEIDGVIVGTAAGIYAVPNSLGEHTITVSAANADLDYGPADQETSTMTDSVTIIDDDTTGPVISIIYSGDATDASPGIWTVSVVDPESGIDWISVEIDGISVGTSAGVYVVPNSLGSHTIAVSAGNADLDFGSTDQETSTQSHTVTIVDDDMTAPFISITYTGDMTATNPGVWTITAFDMESGIFSILVEIDGVVVGTVEGDYAVPGLVGMHSITVNVINNDVDRPSDQESSTSTHSVEIELTTLPTEIIYTGGTSGVYSDPVYLEALLLGAIDQLPIPGKTVMFTLGSHTAYAVTNEDGVASVTIILDQEEGVYELIASFAGNDDYLSSFAVAEFVIYRECVATIYSGVTLVEASEVSLTLRVTVFDDPDGYWGDMTHIYVTFTFYLSSDPLTQVYVTCPIIVRPTDIAGVGLVALEIPNLPEGNYLVLVSLLPEHNRYYCSPDSDTTSVSIYEPERASAMGAGKIRGPDGHKGYFVFNVKYTCKGSLQGFFLYSYVVDNWVYLVKSCEIIGFDTEDLHAFFEANCTFTGFNFKTFEYVGYGEKFRARIDVFDNRRGRERDVFQIRIFDNLGLVEYEAGFDPFGYLMNGCIVVCPGRRY